jgi:hypothetical protein
LTCSVHLTLWLVLPCVMLLCVLCRVCRVRWCAHTLNAKAGVAAASPIRGKQRMGLVAQIRALWEELGMQVQRVSKEI